MNHVGRAGVLHRLPVDRQRLADVHRIAVELLRHNPRPHRSEGVVALADEPVRPAEARLFLRAPAAIRHVELDGVAEDVILRLRRGHILRLLADDDGQLALPVDPLAPARHQDVVAVADDGAFHRLEEQIRGAAILPACVRFLLLFLGCAGLARVAVVVGGRIQALAGIDDRRERLDRRHVPDVGRTAAAIQLLGGGEPRHDLLDALRDAAVVAHDQVLHVRTETGPWRPTRSSFRTRDWRRRGRSRSNRGARRRPSAGRRWRMFPACTPRRPARPPVHS